MTVIVVGAEKTFADLRKRLFTGSVSTKVAGQVSRAIADANPGVNLKALVPGTVITIPDELPDVAVAEDLSLDARSGQALTALVDAGVRALDQLAAAAAAAREAEAADRAVLARTLSGRELRAAVSEDQAMAARLEGAVSSLEQANKLAEEQQAALKRAQSVWSKDLASMRSLLAGEQAAFD